jgi:cytochrome c
MKKVIFIASLFLLISCKKEETKEPLYPKVAQTPEQLGKEIFEGKGNCIACHQPAQKIVGPSIQEIAQTYKDKNASIVAFLKEESEPIVNPDQYEVMKTNFAITKAMSDEELKALEAYVYSNLK